MTSLIPRQLAGDRVYPIAWHVDYWDYLGWPDRFASPAISDRQEHYASVLGLTYLVTPQILVNSSVMSSISTATVNATVNLRLEDPVDVSTTIWLESDPHATPLVVGYSVTGAPPTDQLQIVLVERELVTSCTAGENAGRTLNHDNAARAFVTATGWEGTVEITPPGDAVRENCALFGLVQNWASIEFHGAHGIELVP